MNSAEITLSTPLTSLRGVGAVVSKGLEQLGLTTVRDLLFYYPWRWEDYSEVVTIAAIHPGKVTIAGRIEQLRLSRTARRRVAVTEAIINDGSGTAKAVWFGQPYLVNTLKEGEQYYFSGEFAFKANNLALQNPDFTAALGHGRAGRIVPVYHENSVVNSKLLSKLVAQALPTVTQIEPVLPDEVVATQKLLIKNTAITELHQPTNQRRLNLARRSLGFEELWLLILTGLVIRADIATEKSVAIPFDQAATDQFLAQLPFKLTNDQRAAGWQILQDIARPIPMNRLLQGDVGSGKTVVALLAAVNAIAAGYQVAMMAPTAILARQHFNLATQLLTPLGFQLDWLAAGLTSAERQAVYDRLAGGTTQLAIGTHSLLNEQVRFNRLGLVVIDEQHRFGVNQRTALKSKAPWLPHLLATTATPIPRSLALVVYSDLDMSLIREQPPGRQPIDTKLYMEIERANAYAKIDMQIAAGRQVFIICPLIEDSDTSGAKSVKAEYDRLKRTVFAHRRIALLHGQLKPAEKDQIMRDFAEHTYDILITTSVIEVGVDVPNASVMMIEGADRFGLAALHQLRGRVGRGEHKSYCFLFADTYSEAAVNRLRALERTHDGFRLAQIDLETRGAGEIYGTRQHGELDLRIADISDSKLVAAARASAQAWLGKHNVLQYPRIAAHVNALKKVTTLD